MPVPSSSIENAIREIEDYVAGCKYQPFSSTKIVVDKEEIDELISDLRKKTPEEIRRYQKIITNKDAILEDARQKAEALINNATIQTNELINEHEIMKAAYEQANTIVSMASSQAQQILDNATIEANSVRMAALQYMDDMLAHIDAILTESAQTAVTHYEGLVGSLTHYRDIVEANRRELHPVEEPEDTGIIDLDATTGTGTIDTTATASAAQKKDNLSII